MEVGYWASFTAGLLSFLAPCVLPIVPAYLSYLTGTQAVAGQQESKFNLSMLIPVVFFVLGFSTVFIFMGAGASYIGELFAEYRELIAKVGGAFVIFFGFHFMNLFVNPNFIKYFNGVGLLILSLYLFGGMSLETLKDFAGVWVVVDGLYLMNVHMFLYRQMRSQVQMKKTGVWTSYIVGLSFGAGWSPCIGPVLGSILIYASQTENVFKAMTLLGMYSLGLGIPFLLAGIFWQFFLNFIRKFGKFFTVVEYVGGALLIVLGILLITGQLAIISSQLEG